MDGWRAVEVDSVRQLCAAARHLIPQTGRSLRIALIQSSRKFGCALDWPRETARV